MANCTMGLSGKLSLLLVGTMRLHKTLGQYSSLKHSRDAIGHKPQNTNSGKCMTKEVI